MKPPTKNGYYWVKYCDNKDWEIVKVSKWGVFRCGKKADKNYDEIEEWGNKIEHRENK